MARTKDFVVAMKEDKAERKIKKELKRKAAEEATEAGAEDELPVSESKKSKSKAASTTQDSEAADSTKNAEAEVIVGIQPPNKKRKVSLPSEIEVDITLPEPPSKKALRGLKRENHSLHLRLATTVRTKRHPPPRHQRLK
jgi:hypothetical protein